MGKEPKISFIQADLSLISENKRVVEIVTKEFQQLDALILCAACLKPQECYRETQEGFEFTFALYYLSRYYLSYGLEELLNKSENPVVLNVAAPGMKGKVNWEDIQFKNNYNGKNVQFHGSRLNDLLGVCFNEKSSKHKLRYILFNPMAARTNGAKQMALGSIVMKFVMNMYYKMKGKDVDEITYIITNILNNTSKSGLYAYILNKEIDQSMDTFDKKNAKLLEDYTRLLLSEYM